MQYIIDAIRWLRAKLGWWMWVIAPLYIFIQLFLENIQKIEESLIEINSSLSSFSAGTGALPAATSLWKNANYFFPVEAVLALALYLLQLKFVGWILIRIPKSISVIWR